MKQFSFYFESIQLIIIPQLVHTSKHIHSISIVIKCKKKPSNRSLRVIFRVNAHIQMERIYNLNLYNTETFGKLRKKCVRTSSSS